MNAIRSIFFILCVVNLNASYGQDSVIISASTKYEYPSLVKLMLIGKNYREVWSTPVKMKMFDITKEKGGLKPTELGGGFQTKSLRLEDKSGKEWVLRTIDKDVEKAVPKWLRNTFAQTLVQDMISSAYPYAPLTVGHLAKALQLSAPDPELFYVPDDPRFGKYRNVFANSICMLELTSPTPDNSATKATDKLYESLRENSNNMVDDTTLLKARLLDMLIADWDRHADQWKWGIKEVNGKKIYYPIPRDRDQAFFQSRGLLVKVVRMFTLKHFVGFTDNLKKLNKLNGKSWEFDHLLLNKLTEEDWRRIIAAFQQTINDQMLITAIHKMPPEAVALDGQVLTEKLSKRRNDMMEYGMKYYQLISKDMEIHATDEIDVARFSMDGNKLRLTLQTKGSVNPYFSRSFDPAVTKSIALHLFDGADDIIVDKEVSSKIKIKLDAGKGKNRFDIKGKLKIDAEKDTEKEMKEQQAASK